MNLSFKDRISFHYMIATAILIAMVFSIIYFAVKSTVLNNLDDDLSFEAHKHAREITIIDDSLQFINKAEWEEREHRVIQVNPVFIQLIDKDGKLMDKSPNLKEDYLPFKDSEFGGHFDAEINNRKIRQVQLPIEQKGKIEGYILAAVSSESSFSVILKLRNVLLVSYFTVLIGSYFVSRFLAGRSIVPVQEITSTIARISKHNLQERVKLPPHHDEIHELSSSFNALLQRIEKAIEKEKQFTSDASHELRTPLTILRGTLEVLIRKPRAQHEYEEKIQFSLKEIERMTATIEQLLLLARLETSSNGKNDDLVSLAAIIDDSIVQFSPQITEKNLKINLTVNQATLMLVPHYYGNIIIDNILGNAIKYANRNTTLTINTDITAGKIMCKISDEGVGIKEDDLTHIYDSFFRSDALNHKDIYGTGLGLSIAKKCADAIQAEIKLNSTLDQGTTVSILFGSDQNNI